ncbi:tigger transposable element-derived protein 4-like [Macrobrachium rosenbergii]|uniref:tigger transposable element-derived protein 4-like n=1 Tax=Macrobrachium rosenbergii TaxID=79674 RepID=UPI0034D51DE8
MEVDDVTKCSPATKLDPLPVFTGSSSEDLLMKIEMNDHTANDSETVENTQEQEKKEVKQLPKLRPKKGRKIKVKRKKKMKGTGKVSSSDMQMTEDFTFMRKRRQDLTLGAKVKVLEILDREPKIPQGKIASMFRVSQSQVSRIMKNKETILVQWNRFATPERKRCRVGKAGELEQKLLDWYKDARKDDLPISGPILMEKAKSIGVEMGIDFKPSAGWLGRWKDRNGVTLKVFKEKDGTPSITKVANHWRRYMFVKSTRDVPWQNVWVVDETVLTYNSVPDCMSQMISGGKDRMCVILACNLSGTERKPAAVVGSVQSLEYMSLPVFYYYHEKAKINLECFSSWLREWDRELHLQKKKIVLILNKAKHHPENIHFLNISITHFPLETSKVLQPLQLGIISSFKALYRYQQLRLLLANSKAVEPTSNTNMCSHSSLMSSHSQGLSALDATYLIYKAWKHVSPETIAKGAVKAGLSKDVDALKVNDVVGAPPGISQQDFQTFVVQDNDLCPIDQEDLEKSNSQTKNSAGSYNYSRVTSSNVNQSMPSNQHTDSGTQYLPTLPKVPETVLACQVLRKYLQQQGGRLYDEFSKLEAAIQMDMIQQSYPEMKEEDVIDPFHDPSSVHSFHAHKQAESLKVGYLQKLHHALEQKSLQKELKRAAQVPVSSASDSTSVPTQETRSDALNQNIDVQRHNLSGQELMREDVMQQEIQLPVQRHALIHQVMMRQEYRQDVPVDRSRTTLYEMRPDNVSPLYRPMQPNGSNCQGENKNGNLSSIPTDLRAVPMTDPRAGVASHPPNHSNELPQDIRQPDGRLEHPGIPYYAVHNPLHQCICGNTECCS